MGNPLPLQPLRYHCKIEIDRLNLAKQVNRNRKEGRRGIPFSEVAVATSWPPIYLWGDGDTAFMAASKRHEELVAAKVHELMNEGWRVVTIGNRHPDAIAIKDGVIMAVEILKKYKHVSKAGKNKGWKYTNGAMKQKLEGYAHFDKIAFVTFYDTTGEIADQFVVEPKNAGGSSAQR